MTHEQLEKEREEMTDNDLIKIAEKELAFLCRSGGKSFTMNVPVRVTDTDMIFSELVKRFKKAIK